MPVASLEPVTLRPAVAGDAGTLHRLVLELAESLGSAATVSSTPEDFLQAGWAEQPAFEAILAERDGRAVGFSLYFYSFSSWRGRRGVYLQDIYVAGTERGTGLGRRLVAETARRASAHGISYMRLSVDRANTPAQGFYRELGMEHRDAECIFMAHGAAFEALMHADDPAQRRR